jgi:hypothetical protein
MLSIQITLVTKSDGSLDTATMTGEFHRRLAALQVAFTGQGPKVTLSKREQQATALGEMLCPTKKRRGREPDPKSNYQRIQKVVRKLLAKGEMQKDKLIAEVAKQTGIPVATCTQNAMAFKGIRRNWGLWSLAST